MTWLEQSRTSSPAKLTLSLDLHEDLTYFMCLMNVSVNRLSFLVPTFSFYSTSSSSCGEVARSDWCVELEQSKIANKVWCEKHVSETVSLLVLLFVLVTITRETRKKPVTSNILLQSNVSRLTRSSFTHVQWNLWIAALRNEDILWNKDISSQDVTPSENRPEHRPSAMSIR
jgi:hypothetical protein